MLLRRKGARRSISTYLGAGLLVVPPGPWDPEFLRNAGRRFLSAFRYFLPSASLSATVTRLTNMKGDALQ